MRRLLAAGAGALALCLAVVVVPAAASHAAERSVGGSAAFHSTETIEREFLVNGHEKVVDKRTVSLTVSETRNLRGRQEVAVSWTGAHPTGGIVADENSIDAQQEEYPMVLLECRGTSANSPNPADRLSPETCWTQTWSERYQDTFQTEFPPYRIDQFASVADRAQVVGAPDPLPESCAYLPAPTQHWVPFIAAGGHVYYGGPAGCAGEAPGSQDVEGSGFPSNETFGVTGLDGKGSADFDIWTSDENAALGCSETVPCSLVAVPIMGISCDPQAKDLPAGDRPTGSAYQQAKAMCEATGAFAPGQIADPPEGLDDLTVSGSLWWSASNWRNRIVVPLTFAVPASVCTIVGSNNVVDVYGSELLIQATSQWAPHFCLNKKLFSFVHVQTGEPEARSFLATGSSVAAFSSDAEPGGWDKPVVSAPTALTGFAISYDIDGANGQPYTRLRLTPLLLAKLLTESYPAELPVQEEDPALSHNPLNITDDPEFQQLNPGITHGVDASEAASELMAISSDSDVIEALTTYINDNPTARAWLNGTPDKWGMVVNPAYRGIKLPVDQWPLLSTFEPKEWYASDNNNCLYNDPQPYLPLVAAPQQTLEEVSESLQFDIANSTTYCSQVNGSTTLEKLTALGQQTPGYRFLIGITPLADDDRYQLRPAALETTNGHFVTPTVASLRAAAAMLAPDEKTGTWPIPYEKMRSTRAGEGAYPGTMVVYTDVPTSGLTAETASDLAQFLTFVATKGQRQGLGVGELPPGYLPLTKANGLAPLAAYTLAAAQAVAAQKGVVPPLVPKKPSGGTTTTTTSTTTTTPVTPTTTVTPTTVVRRPPHHHGGGTKVVSVVPFLGRTLGLPLGTGSLLAVLLAALGLLGLVGVPSLYVVGRRRGRW